MSSSVVPCAQSVRDHVSVEWFQRLCHISGVQWPQLQSSPVPDEWTLCVDLMSDDTSVQVPCCQQHLHIICLVRSFTSCGFHCPLCNQCLSDFARSGSFQASAILQGCMIDVDAQLPTRVPIRWLFPLVSPLRQQGMSSFVALSWARILLSSSCRIDAWSGPRSSLLADGLLSGYVVSFFDPPSFPRVSCSRYGEQCLVFVTDFSSGDSGMWCPSCQLRTECENPVSSCCSGLCTAAAELVQPRTTLHVSAICMDGEQSRYSLRIPGPSRGSCVLQSHLVCWMLNILEVFQRILRGRVFLCQTSSEHIGWTTRWISSTLSVNIFSL